MAIPSQVTSFKRCVFYFLLTTLLFHSYFHNYLFIKSFSILYDVTGDEKLAASVTLPLAERMIGVMEKEKKIKQEQETRLFLMVLELQVLAKQRLIEKFNNLKFIRPEDPRYTS
jgi:hypothetical protein